MRIHIFGDFRFVFFSFIYFRTLFYSNTLKVFKNINLSYTWLRIKRVK